MKPELEAEVRDLGLRRHIAHHQAMESFDWPTFQSTIEVFSFTLRPSEPLPRAEALVWASELNSGWQQIFHLYYALAETAIKAYGYWMIAPDFTDEQEHLGVRHSFQMYYEDFLYRLFTFREMSFQLSNVYHRRGLKPQEVRVGYWKELTKEIRDPYVAAVETHMFSSPIEKLRDLRNSMTHRMVFDMVGIGWGTLSPRYDAEGKIKGVGLGQHYIGKLEFDTALEELRVAFQQVTQFLETTQLMVQEKLEALQTPQLV